MRQFHVEGFVTEYVATSTGSSEVVFISESLENIPAGWRARETWRITGADSSSKSLSWLSRARTLLSTPKHA